MVQSQTVRQRSIEVVCLSRYLHLLVRAHTAERTHVVETVGQLDEQGTDVVLH